MSFQDYQHLLACPLTHEKLEIAEDGTAIYLKTASSGRRYEIIDGVPRLISASLPERFSSRWQTWRILQDNGEFAYRAHPTANTSQDVDDAAAALAAFHIGGRVLDVGCGPGRVRPAYAAGISQHDYVGLDPLLGQQPKDFNFVHAQAEALPFLDDSFDSVIFYSSLDHVLDLDSALSEASRVLKPGGWINIWMDKDSPPEGVLGRGIHLVQRGTRQLLSAMRELGLARALAYVYRLASMPIPEGARDQFHLQFPTPTDVIAQLAALGYRDLASKDLGSEIAFSMQRVK